MTDMDPMAEPHTYHGPVPLDEADPELVEALRSLEARWGSLGVALTAAQLSDVPTVIRCLEGPERAQRIRELEDRVLANIDARGDADDLRRENTELRAQLADAPTSEAAIAKLREWSASAGPAYEYGPGATHIAMSVAMARKILDEIDGLETELAETRADRETFRRTLEQDAAERARRRT